MKEITDMNRDIDFIEKYNGVELVEKKVKMDISILDY